MPADAWLIGRQPILDRAGAVAGYELLFRAARAGPAQFTDASYASASVILGALAGIGLDEVLGGKRGFVNIGQELLFSDGLELLPREQVVLELLESVEPTPEVVRRCRGLKAAGFALALDDHRFHPRFEPLYGLVDLVKLDLLDLGAGALPAEVAALRPYPVTLVAEKVETAAQFRACLDLGFQLFQGFHFERPAVLERRRVDEAGATVLKVLKLLADGADVRILERGFRDSPGLTYRLLVLVNSVAFGARERIASVGHAITLLGQPQLRRWLQLALFASDDRRGLDDPLVDMAGFRAGLMEALARVHPRLRAVGDAPEQAYMAGVLSLLDGVYALPMAELAERLRLAEPLAAALTARAGPLGELLAAVERVERLEVSEAFEQLGALGIGREDFLAAQRAAFGWRAAMG